MVEVQVKLINDLHPSDRDLVLTALLAACQSGFIFDGVLCGTVTHDVFSAFCVMEDMGVLEVEQC